MKLTGPQQDRAAGLLVGMAVGDAHGRAASSAAQRKWGLPTTTTWTALNILAPSHNTPAASFDTVKKDISRVRAIALATSEPGEWVDATTQSPLAIAAAVALVTLGEAPERTFELAQALMGRTFDDDLAMACGAWSAMLAEAVRSGDADLKEAAVLGGKLAHVRWAQAAEDAEASHPMDVVGGNLAMHQVLKAWSVVAFSRATPGPQRFVRNVSPEALQYFGAGPTGALVGTALGATRGFSAIPYAWRRDLTGALGGTSDILMRRAITVGFGPDLEPERWPNVAVMDYSTWPARHTSAQHPSDPGVHLGGVGALETVAPSAAVSLCRLGTAQRPPSLQERDHATFWLVDSNNSEDNPNLSFVLDDAAATVQTFREEQKRVLIHCVQAQSRTPAVAALYGRLATGDSALGELEKIVGKLPPVDITKAFTQQLKGSPTVPSSDELKWSGEHRLKRHAIELISWTAATELLRLHPDAWLEVATEGSAAQARQFEVAFPGQGYVGFRRAGKGIISPHRFVSHWPDTVMSGDVDNLVRDIEQGMGLVRPQSDRALSIPARLAAFAAAVVAMSYGAVSDISLGPSARWRGDYLHGIRPTEQSVHMHIVGHQIEARDDESIHVDGRQYDLPSRRPEIQQAALAILQDLGVLDRDRSGA